MTATDNVLCCYAAANLEGIHWPTMADIATVIGVSPQAVGQSADRLVERLAYSAGVHARRQGKPRAVPEGAPATGHDAFLQGWDEETRRLALVTGEA